MIAFLGQLPAEFDVGPAARALDDYARAKLPISPGFLIRAGLAPDALALARPVDEIGGFPVTIRAGQDADGDEYAAPTMDTLLHRVADARSSARAAGQGEATVLVQHHVRPDLAGAAWSTHPRSGQPGEAMIEAVHVDPETETPVASTFTARHSDGRVVARQLVDPRANLSDAQIAALTGMVGRVRDLLGGPAEATWAIEPEGRLFLLHARRVEAPVKTVGDAPTPSLYSRARAGLEKVRGDGGVFRDVGTRVAGWVKPKR